MMRMINLTFKQWLRYGESHGYCSPQFCNTHDGAPMHPTEEAQWEEGNDPCMHMVRLGSIEDWDVGE
jgi:hypothetical protein